MKTVIFRVKGGNGYGWGHVIRMTVLADFMKDRFNGLGISFIIEGSKEVVRYVQHKGFTVYEVPFDLDIGKEKSWWPFNDPIPLIIVDVYRIVEDRARFLREKCHRLVIFSDIEEKYPFADILIYPQSFEHDTEVREKKQIKLKGPNYFILNREYLLFHDRSKNVLPRTKRLLICLGGTTHHEGLLKVAQSISPIQGFFEKIVFIVGYENNLELSKKLHESLPKADIIDSTVEIPKLLYEADMAIIAGGFIKYELAAVGTPGIIVSLVKHQHELSVKFSSTMAAEYIGYLPGLKPEDIRNAVVKLSQNYNRRKEMSLAGKQLVDGLALERLTPFLLNQLQ